MTGPIPCPLCGRQPKFTGFGSCLGYYGNFTCTDSRHHVEISVNAETEAEAIEKATQAWNKRHYPKEIKRGIDLATPKKNNQWMLP